MEGAARKSLEDSNEPLAGESQASQIIRNVFSGGMDSVPKSHIPGLSYHSGDSDDIASGSPSRTSVPRYHYHGLAQSQHEEHLESQGSQKENAPAAGELNVLPSSTSGLASPHNSTSLLPQKSPQVVVGSPSGGFATNTKSSKLAASQPPRGSTTTLSPITTLLSRPRPERLMPSAPYNTNDSQDSFAGPLSQDPEKEFLATTRQFDVPLSELGGIYTQDGTASEMDRTALSRSGHKAPAPSSRRSDQEIILVPATPSNSGSSQSQPSQPYQPSQGPPESQDPVIFGGRQPMEFDDEANMEVGQADASADELSQASSGYARLLNGEPYSTQQETQVADFQPTQPSSESVDLVGDVVDDQQSIPGLWMTPGVPASPSNNTTTTPRANPRSILSMVDPRKRVQRMQKLHQEPAAHGIVDDATQMHPADPSPLQIIPETPSKDSIDYGTAPEDQPLPFKPASAPYLHHQRDATVNPPADLMDVVPDSEPPQASEPIVTGKKRFREVMLSDEEADSGEIVPDSCDQDGEGRSGGMEKLDDDDGDDGDDIPLAATRRGRGNTKAEAKTKGKGKEKEKELSDMLPPPSVTKGRSSRTTKNLPSSKGKGKGTATSDGRTATKGSGMGRKSHSVEEGEIASSAPEQDGVGPLTRKKSTRKNPAPRSRTRSASTTSGARVSKKRRIVLPSAEDDSDDNPADEEDGTEPADEEQYADDDEDIRPNIAGPSTRQRKPVISKGKASGISRSSTKTGKRSTTTRSQSRLHSMVSMTFYATPTKVFALWKDDGHYYSGQIESHQSGTKYIVEFDDHAKCAIELDKMRRCELNVGDNVIVNHNHRKARVINVDGDNVVLEVDDGIELDQAEYEPRDIRIASRSLGAQWKNRYLDKDAIITMVDEKQHEAPRSKLLAKTGLLVSMSERIENWRQIKEQVLTAIKRNGGVVIDDILDVIDIPGKYFDSKRRWIGEGKDVKWKQRTNIERVFLLSNDATEKSKYLMSLALGIPCLHINWLQQLLKQDRNGGADMDWQPFLLPQGYSALFRARVSQFVDLDWCNSPEHLQDIMANQVARKPFADKSILCIGPDFMPEQRKNKSNDEGKEKCRAVPRIILTMGAAQVEIVTAVERATSAPTTFDYVVVEDDAILDEYGAMCVPVKWVKACLIAGRLLDVSDDV